MNYSCVSVPTGVVPTWPCFEGTPTQEEAHGMR